jgi:cation diffusion facilitator family transporter
MHWPVRPRYAAGEFLLSLYTLYISVGDPEAAVMADDMAVPGHSHVFLGEGHARAERRSWAVIWLCAAMMILEIGGGLLFGSIALVADGLHMSTHAGALLLAALAYSYARRHADDPRFTFGTGKLGDLAGFTSAIVLAMISLLIGYEAVQRFFVPVPIRFGEAIPIACLGLAVNVASVWLLGGGDHGHGHTHGHGHAHGHGGHHDGRDHESTCSVMTRSGRLLLSIYEEGVPPRFRVHPAGGVLPADASVETLREDGARQIFRLRLQGAFLESEEEIPEPHAFTAVLRVGSAEEYAVPFEEHVHGDAHTHGTAGDAKMGRDNNMRAAIVHVIADAMVSVMVIAGLLLARTFGWLWMDPLAGVIGAGVIASWAYGLVKDTGAILLDMTPDHGMAAMLRQAIERDGDRLADFHMWRLGPGHLGAIISVVTVHDRTPAFYRARLARFRALSHVTIEVEAA